MAAVIYKFVKNNTYINNNTLGLLLVFESMSKSPEMENHPDLSNTFNQNLEVKNVKLLCLVTFPPLLFSLFLFFKFYLLFLAALGLRCCTRAFSSCGEQRLLFVAVRGLLIAVASLVAEHGL